MRSTRSAATASAASRAASSRASSATDFGGFIYTGDPTLLGAQVLGILVTIAFVVVLDVVLALIVKALFKGSLRVSEEDEAVGLDVSEHGESAYPAYVGLD